MRQAIGDVFERCGDGHARLGSLLVAWLAFFFCTSFLHANISLVLTEGRPR